MISTLLKQVNIDKNFNYGFYFNPLKPGEEKESGEKLRVSESVETDRILCCGYS
jgi:hypothetical protein